MPKSSTVRPLARDLLARSSGEVTGERMADVYESSLDRVQGALLIPIDHIDLWSENPRRSYDESYIASLAGSIAENGLLELPTVRRDPDKPGHYVITTGNCRLLALRRLHGSTGPELRHRFARMECRLKEQDEAEAFADAVAENVARNDLSRPDYMAAVVRMQDRYGHSARTIARRIGRDYSDISELLRLARHPILADVVNSGTITATAAGTVLGLPEEIRDEAIARVRDGRIKTVRDATRFNEAHQARQRLARLQAAPYSGAAAAEREASAAGHEASDSAGATREISHASNTVGEPKRGGAPHGSVTNDEQEQRGISHTPPSALVEEIQVRAHSRTVHKPTADPAEDELRARLTSSVSDEPRTASNNQGETRAHVRATQDLLLHIQAYVRQATSLDNSERAMLREAHAALGALIAAYED